MRRTTLLLVLAAVVLSLGLVAGNGAGEDRPASYSEIAQTDARAASLELARQAGELADAEGTGRLAAELTRQADVLAEQSALLIRPGSLRRGVPPFEVPTADAGPASGASGADGTSGTSPTDAGYAARYVQSMAAAAHASLDAAMRADAGTARLLAATGAAQQVLAVRAAVAAGLNPPQAWEPVAPAGSDARCVPETSATDSGLTGAPSSAPSGAASSVPSGAASSVPSGAASGTGGSAPDAAAALKGAIDAEYGAAYAYEVAMARASGVSARTELDEARDSHLAAGAQGVLLLPEVCLPALTRAPAYSLPPSFQQDPSGALEDLEASLPAVYADLAALGSGAVRAWAVERLAQLSTELYSGQRAVPTAPGLGQETEGLPRSPGTA
ncbi:DUF4439 domain-containing protein [Arthrobacter sp. zg-Y1219]|uniref:DUF4439 domain-containing protein n=1 Tax=Arthrobacter sp. zg-Y1219 TaxID=3049067 RepID=UPI0024C3034C|nr:DUF4439 domain-containing protein [Arthrobacter sp. zg-Y1219]MDK1360339.1 DUF4439 domain-containing protein [Arthrobacter sp. zg-Y1219]